jgi:peptidoglycan-associated lipoprotein
MRKILFLAASVLAVPAAPALGQGFPFGLGGGQRQAPAAVPVPIDVLRAQFGAEAGGTTIYFVNGSSGLGPQARTILTGQAAWLRRHPEISVRIEGHGDAGDTRDHALAVGAKRAEEARLYLLLLGVPAAQVSAMTWGKERPGAPRAVTAIVR